MVLALVVIFGTRPQISTAAVDLPLARWSAIPPDPIVSSCLCLLQQITGNHIANTPTTPTTQIIHYLTGFSAAVSVCLLHFCPHWTLQCWTAMMTSTSTGAKKTSTHCCICWLTFLAQALAQCLWLYWNSNLEKVSTNLWILERKNCFKLMFSRLPVQSSHLHTVTFCTFTFLSWELFVLFELARYFNIGASTRSLARLQTAEKMLWLPVSRQPRETTKG